MTELRDEGQKARHWREQVMRLSLKELSELTGYSVTAIRCFESNANSSGELFGEPAWRRYRMACAGVWANGAVGSRSFKWGQGEYHASQQR